MELGAHRPWVPQSTLETDFPLPLYSDQYVTLRGPRQAPVLRQAVRWKTTPMGWDAAGQSWATGLSGWDAPGDPWYSLTRGILGLGGTTRGGCWWWRENSAPPPVYAQHLREVAWWDPIVPAAYPGPRTRWGAFLWQERPILGKEYGKSCRGGRGGGGTSQSPLLTPVPSSPQLPPAARAPGRWGAARGMSPCCPPAAPPAPPVTSTPGGSSSTSPPPASKGHSSCGSPGSFWGWGG
uniref:Uncharacterized protein n=1 Tax=Anas platyrhynchos platyrhynchos TaxID=8840 RepID=A0A493TU87_ANAPP